MNTHRSLHTKIIVWSLAPTLITVVAVILLLFYAVNRGTEIATILAAEQLGQTVKSVGDTLLDLARTPDMYRGDHGLQSMVLRQSGRMLNDFDAGVVLLNPMGFVISSVPMRPELLEQDWSWHPYYIELKHATLDNQAAVFSDALPLGPGGELVVCTAVPILDEEGQFRGVLVGMQTLGLRALVRADAMTFFRSLLLDSTGRVIHHSQDGVELGADLAGEPLVQRVLRGESGAESIRDFDGRKVFAGFAPVPGTRWGLVTEVNWDALFRGRNIYVPVFMLLLGFGVVIPLIIVNIGASKIMLPLLELIGAAKEVAQGNFGRTIRAGTGDEIEVLAHQFNMMSKQLKTSYTELEQRVAARTRELATLNAIASVVNRSLNLEEVLNTALDEVLARLGLEAGCIQLMESDERMTLRVQRGFAPELLEILAELKVGEGISGRAVLDGRPVVLGLADYESIEGAAALIPLLRAAGVQTLVSTPIICKGLMLGALTLASRQPGAFPSQEQALLASIGQQIGVAVENAQLYDQVQQELSERKRTEQELRNSKEQLKLAIEGADLGLWDLNMVTGMMASPMESPGMEVYRRDDIMNDYEGWMASIYPDDRPLVGQAVALYESGAAPLFELEYRTRNREGEWGWVALRGKVVEYDNGGQPVRMAGISQDVTARRRAEEELRLAKEAAEAANRAKSVFLANMSHELRTPLNAILGFTQLMLKDTALTSAHQENLDIIDRSGKHLLTLINDVLEMSKIEAGRTTLFEQSFDLHRMLADLESMFRLRARDKGLALTFEREADVPPYVRTDESKLRQVLINLLGNAVKFTAEGGVTLHVGYQPAPAGADVGARLTFAVEDTGPGISTEDLEKLFDPFVQTTSGQLSQEGTGLGLPISREFIKLMDGDIGVDSTIGVGSVFRFHVRVGLASAADVAAEAPLRRVVGLTPGQPVYRILIAEDKWANRKLLTRLLEPLGFEVREAINGQEALEIWESWSPHLILMDMRMPVMDGHEATRRIKATTKGQATVIIALTASAFEEDRRVILSEGCDDFVRKPFREEEIFERLARHLGVRFVYEEEALAPALKTDQAEVLLTPAAVATLPAHFRTELLDAAIQADADRVLSLLQWLSQQQMPVGLPGGVSWTQLTDALESLVHNFRFDLIVQLIQPE